MKNQVQLITYVDRLSGGGLRELTRLLEGPLAGLFGGVHLLPFFFPIDGADAGFDPVDHTRIDPRLGNWDDIKVLSRTVEVMGDVIVNHVSSGSPQFADFVREGTRSRYAGLFLTMEKVFPDGATERDITAIYRPRPGLPFTVVTLASGERRAVWTTFTPQQVDIDVLHPEGQSYLQGILDTYADNGVKMVRLDAVGYAIKKAGTSCFMIPETFEFIDSFAAEAHRRGIELLVEIHSYYRKQVEIARRVDWVYDFALPPLVLHALAFGTAKHLKHWLAIRPANALTVLDTHDGIGVIDIGPDPADREARPGLVPDGELDRLVEIIHERSAGASRLATGAAASNLDLYQVNCTFYDAVGRSDREYLLARAIQFFLPGIPQVYYVGLLAGGNDLELLGRTKVGRDINRHYYTDDEIGAALSRQVVANLFELIRFRNRHPAFTGLFKVLPSADDVLHLRWESGDEVAELRASMADISFEIICSHGGELGPLRLGERHPGIAAQADAALQHAK
jgi:sucrose phosphorylase